MLKMLELNTCRRKYTKPNDLTFKIIAPPESYQKQVSNSQRISNLYKVLIFNVDFNYIRKEQISCNK